MSAPFDEKELLERVDHDMEFLAETVQMLCTDGRSLLGDVRGAVDGGNAAALARSAHTLKGMISNFCAPVAHAAAYELEKAGKGGDLAGAAEAVGRLQARIDELTAALNEFVATRK